MNFCSFHNDKKCEIKYWKLKNIQGPEGEDRSRKQLDFRHLWPDEDSRGCPCRAPLDVVHEYKVEWCLEMTLSPSLEAHHVHRLARSLNKIIHIVQCVFCTYGYNEKFFHGKRPVSRHSKQSICWGWFAPCHHWGMDRQVAVVYAMPRAERQDSLCSWPQKVPFLIS